jgi:peroxiredoxin
VELEALQASLPAIESLKARIVAVSPQSVEINRKTAEKLKLSFPLLSDPGNRVADAYGLKHGFPDDLREIYQKFNLDLPAHNPEDPWTLPLPARFVITNDGVIRKAWVNADYTQRPEPEETLEVVRGLN